MSKDRKLTKEKEIIIGLQSKRIQIVSKTKNFQCTLLVKIDHRGKKQAITLNISHFKMLFFITIIMIPNN